MNELLLILEIIIIFSMLLISKKLFGKNGLLVWMGLATVLANIQVIKSVDLFGLNSTLGNVLFASTFLATDIMSECYGKETSKQGVFIGLFSVILYLVVTQMSLLFQPNDIDVANDAMKILFGLAPRICISSVLMYFVANMADIWLFEKLRKLFNGKKLWLRNNVSTIVCNVGETFIFTFLAFTGVYSVQDMLMIAWTSAIIETFIALCDTPFLYWAKKIK